MHRTCFRIGFFCLALAASLSRTSAIAQTPEPAAKSDASSTSTPDSESRSDSDAVSRIVGAAMTRGGASAFLETLTDSVGARVTGSPQCRSAADLILASLRQAGLDSAHFEEYPLESRWQRGPASAAVVAPVTRALTVTSYGWVPGTAKAPGTSEKLEASLFDLGNIAALQIPASAGNLKGAAVLVDPRATADDSAVVVRASLARALAAAGASVMLIPSDKPDRMVYTSGFGFYPRGPLPVISVAKEDALFLRRLLAHGPVRLAFDIQNSFDLTAGKERNVIADLPGADPGEVILIGAHFDSWDPAQGANDDGSGVAAVLEAARILKSLGLRPRRTIRFVFFSGEEEALLGSRAYVLAHQNELDHLRAVLIMDSGAQTSRGIHIQGRADLQNSLEKVLAPLAPLGANGISLEGSFDEDHAPFLVAGVPAFTLWVDDGQYDVYHHSIADTFDKVDPRLLALDTAVMAVAAYTLANSEEKPAARLGQPQVDALLKKLALASTRDMLYSPPGP